MSRTTTPDVDPAIVIFGIITIWTGRRPPDWGLGDGPVEPYISVDGERAAELTMEIVSEIGDPGLVRLVLPTLDPNSPVMIGARDGKVAASKYHTLVLAEGRLQMVAERLWEVFQPRWMGQDS